MVKVSTPAEVNTLSGLPASIAIRAAQLAPTDGWLLVVEEGDDLRRLPLPGRGGLLGYVDNPMQGFDSVIAWQESGERFFAASIGLSGGGQLVVVVPDAPWLHPLFRLVLDLEAQCP